MTTPEDISQPLPQPPSAPRYQVVPTANFLTPEPEFHGTRYLSEKTEDVCGGIIKEIKTLANWLKLSRNLPQRRKIYEMLHQKIYSLHFLWIASTAGFTGSKRRRREAFEEIIMQTNKVIAGINLRKQSDVETASYWISWFVEALGQTGLLLATQAKIRSERELRGDLEKLHIGGRGASLAGHSPGIKKGRFEWLKAKTRPKRKNFKDE